MSVTNQYCRISKRNICLELVVLYFSNNEVFTFGSYLDNNATDIENNNVIVLKITPINPKHWLGRWKHTVCNICVSEILGLHCKYLLCRANEYSICAISDNICTPSEMPTLYLFMKMHLLININIIFLCNAFTY